MVVKVSIPRVQVVVVVVEDPILKYSLIFTCYLYTLPTSTIAVTVYFGSMEGD